MKPETAILRDLLAGQSTADSLAPRVRLQPIAATAILDRLVREKLVTRSDLNGLNVYRLTPATIQNLTTDH